VHSDVTLAIAYINDFSYLYRTPIHLAARSRAWVCGRSLAVITGSNPNGGMSVSRVSAVCCQVKFFESG